MRMKRLLALVAVLSGALLGAVAPPARAEVPTGEGVYSYLDTAGGYATWHIRTACTPQCVAQVTTAPGHGFAAPLVNGRPTVTRIVPNGVNVPCTKSAKYWPMAARGPLPSINRGTHARSAARCTSWRARRRAVFLTRTATFTLTRIG